MLWVQTGGGLVVAQDECLDVGVGLVVGAADRSVDGREGEGRLRGGTPAALHDRQLYQQTTINQLTLNKTNTSHHYSLVYG